MTPPTPPMSERDLYLFSEGNHCQLYRHLGAHLRPGGGVRFAVWAPSARGVEVVGGFNRWSEGVDVLERLGSSGIWWAEVEAAQAGDLYKLSITAKDGQKLPLKSDPFGRAHEVAPHTASIVARSEHVWGDHAWMSARGALQREDRPMSVYEMHLGSWRRDEAGEMLTYRQIAPLLIDHLRRFGFTHVELLPVMDHPFYGSWGYQTTGYFAPSRRQGSIDDLKSLIDALHQAGFGVLLDWVPSHFPEDAHALARFDGTPLFEHGDPRRGFHPDWKSCIFDYDKPEVRSFLLSSARFWIEEFHADGLRVDAVASMLYLDYSRGEDEWLPNVHGGKEHLGAIALLRRLNETLYLDFPGIHTIAEESTAWPGVSRPTSQGGLGFGMKWDMGWMHDTLGYLARDPVHRRHHHNELTFRALYAWSERYMLALSHDEVVHAKGSLLGKMPGDAWQRFANLRLLYGAMFAQPGKKLLFMGAELAQAREWSHDRELDWELLKDPKHAGIAGFIAELNALLSALGALHELDFEPRGFEWIEADDAAQSVLSFLRWDASGRSPLLAVANFTPVVRRAHRLRLPPGFERRLWRVALNSDEARFGGSGLDPAPRRLDSSAAQGDALELTLPPLAILWLTPQ